MTDKPNHAPGHKTDIRKIHLKKIRQSLKPVVVTTADGPQRFKLPHPRLVLAIVVLVIVVSTAAALLVHRASQPTAQQKQADKHTQALQAASKANNSRDYNKEAQGLKDYLATDPPAQYASKASLRLATAYINDKDYDKAIATLEEVKSKYSDKETDFAAIRGLGLVYMMRGDDKQSKDDYRKALDYYNQALKIETSDADLQQIAGSDQNNVRYLQEQLQ